MKPAFRILRPVAALVMIVAVLAVPAKGKDPFDPDESNVNLQVIKDASEPPTISVPVQSTSPSSKQIMEWDNWHRRVATVLFQQVQEKACKLLKSSPPLSVSASYCVTPDGTIKDERVLTLWGSEHAATISYAGIVLNAIRSLSGDPVLKFPAGCNEKGTVEKMSTFWHNCQRHGIGDFPPARPSWPHELAQ